MYGCVPDDDTRLMRRIKRDVAERGRDVMNVLEQYQKFVKPAFDQFVAPSRRCATQAAACMHTWPGCHDVTFNLAQGFCGEMPARHMHTVDRKCSVIARALKNLEVMQSCMLDVMCLTGCVQRYAAGMLTSSFHGRRVTT